MRNVESPGPISYRTLVARDRLDMLYRHSVGFVSRRENPIFDFRESLRAALFEEIAFAHVSGGNKDLSQYVLDPEMTVDFFQGLYPGAKKVNIGLQTTLEGISVPDGLRIVDGKVQTFFEYTTRRFPFYRARKAFSSFEYKKKRSPDIADDAGLTYVVPKNSLLTPEFIRTIARGESRRLHVEPVPFTARDLHDIERDFYKNYVPDDDATTLSYARIRTLGYELSSGSFFEI